MEEEKYAQFLQINMKNGNFVQIGVKDFAEYKAKKELILMSKKEWVDIIDTCTARKSDIVLIEYHFVPEPTKNANKKGGKNKWQRK